MHDRRWIPLALLLVSIVPVVQQVRSAIFWSDGRARYKQHYVDSLPIRFGGHTVSVADDQAHTGDGSQRAVRGLASVLVDGRPIASSEEARVRPGLDNVSRYHRWISVDGFTDRVTGERFLLVARLREHRYSPRIDLLRIDANGDLSFRRVTYALRSESFPQFRVISGLGDESHDVYDFAYWVLPFMTLAVVGPWVGVVVSIAWLCWQFWTEYRARRRGESGHAEQSL